MSRSSLIVVSALAVLHITLTVMYSARSSALRDVPTLHMTPTEISEVLAHFEATAPTKATGNITMDAVWARRVYAPMKIHTPALASYHAAISRAFPDHSITFDVIFAAADNEVPWHCDFDSLGPFEYRFDSISNDDFITVHANLVQPPTGGGVLRTLDSLAVASVHHAANRLTNGFGALGSLTAPLAATMGARAHDGAPGSGNAFNNLRAHSVTAGSGRVSYVVRLVRRNVLLSADKVRAAARGDGATRRIREFERFLPLLPARGSMLVGDFPWWEA